jgi:hypothetical protein
MARRGPGWAYRTDVGVLPPAGASGGRSVATQITPVDVTIGSGPEQSELGADHIAVTVVPEPVR